ncbi:MAG: NB-ARC domain-containing protein [Cyanobacteria bacterium P01_E01_bin.42]
MTIIPPEFLQEIADEYGVTDAELEVLSLAIQGVSNAEIAARLNIQAAAARKRLGEIYKKFHISGAGPGKLAKLQQILVERHRMKEARGGDDLEPKTDPSQPLRDWGQAPDVSIFYGREEELQMATTWMLEEECRVLALLGMGGIGKTSLSVKLAQQSQEEFDCVLWRSLRQAPSLSELLTDLLRTLARPARSILSDPLDEKISHLIKVLRDRQCLLVLDRVDAILSPEELAGQYRDGYRNYGDFFRRLAEETHQSCVVITSLETPREIALRAGNNTPVRTMTLDGLQPDDAAEIFKVKGLDDKADEKKKWAELVNLYRGNPLALKIVATTIKELFGGSVKEFLKQNTLVFGDIDSLLEQQLSRLSELEREIVYWLAIERFPASMEQLQNDILLPLPPKDLFEALESLKRRSLIEKSQEDGGAVFALQPVVMEYITQQLVEQVCAEIVELSRTQKLDKVKTFRSHALLKVDEEDSELRTLQENLLLKPVKERLLRMFRSDRRLSERLSKIQTLLEDKFPLEVGYSIDNILNLLGELNLETAAN